MADFAVSAKGLYLACVRQLLARSERVPRLIRNYRDIYASGQQDEQYLVDSRRAGLSETLVGNQRQLIIDY